jgi:peptidoglycan-associated lipoprotein
MLKPTRFLMAGALIVCGLTVAGCAKKAGRGGGIRTGGTTDTLDPREFDLELSERFEDGTPVTDATFQNVQFRYDNYQIDPSEAPKIEAVADYMQSNADTRLIAEGHCDERGSREYNLALGEHRSQAVRAYLISLGVEGHRIQTRSHGEERPLDPGHGESAWRLNRRVEFSLYR